MSAVHALTISCDAHGCRAAFTADPKDSTTYARSVATSRGWRCIYGVDKCPDHLPPGDPRNEDPSRTVCTRCGSWAWHRQLGQDYMAAVCRCGEAWDIGYGARPDLFKADVAASSGSRTEEGAEEGEG